MIRMKALRTFRGSGEGDVMIFAGKEFETERDRRADDLERHGLATRIAVVPVKPAEQNKAADAGPLPSDGGQTGEAKPPSSLPADQVQQKSVLPRAKAKRGR